MIVWMYEKGKIINNKFKTLIPPNGKMFVNKKKAKKDSTTWAQQYDTKLFRLNTKTNKRDNYEYYNIKKKIIYKR